MIKTKTIPMIALIATLSIFLTAFVSAAQLSFKDVNFPEEVAHDLGAFAITFKLENTGAADTAVNFEDSIISSDQTVTIVRPSVSVREGTVSDPSTTQVLTAIVNYPAHQSGVIEGKIIAKSGSATPRELPFSVNILESSKLSIVKKLDSDLTQTQNGVFELKNSGNKNLNDVRFTQTGDFSLTFNPPTFLNLNAGETKEVTVSGNNLNNMIFGSNTVTISAQSGETSSNVIQYTLDKGFCKVGEKGGNLVIKDVNIDNLGEGSDDEWQILDNIEVEVKVKNEGKEKIRDVIVELALFDDEGNDVTSDLDFENSGKDEEEMGNLDDREDDTVTFKFKVTSDLDKSNYKFAIKAYSDDLGEELECTQSSKDLSDDFFESISIEREDKEENFLKIDNLKVNPSDVTCGDTVDVSFDVVNVGDEDIEDQFRVSLDSTQLGISLSQDIKKDLDKGDTRRVVFTMRVPEIADGAYPLKISTEHEYEDNTDSYDVQSTEEASVVLTVFGCSIQPGQVPLSGDKVASISATLDSDAKAGEQMIVRAIVTNLADEEKTFIISATGFESWAGLDSISKRIVTLGAGASENIVVSFSVNDDAEGQQSFVLEARSGEEFESREIAVNIEGASTGTGTGVSGIDLGGNNLLWLIGVINVILIVLIIVVAVRISRR